MIERVHEHIITELQQNTRTDTIFILTAILLNLLTLGINSAVVGASEDKSATTWIVFFTFISLLIVVNIVAEIGLLKGRQTRVKLIGGLLKIYKDQSGHQLHPISRALFYLLFPAWLFYFHN